MQLKPDRDIVQLLLKKGADIRASDTMKSSTLHFLIRGGLSDLLTPEEKNVKSSDSYGLTLLHEAASAGDQKLVEYCIENNCDINARTNTGLTARI
ncbi:hypothetical protein AVEN_66328-1 [Araneus ventricosus]|uniref:Uncharacterized protein n=1 Tax=Araneus ventricosus TaxID=182803 RepID=A0A4Y2SV87_ARAVE|nr:hypothetical protein AVEN_66328-1 [Araneus ventricosus]